MTSRKKREKQAQSTQAQYEQKRQHYMRMARMAKRSSQSSKGMIQEQYRLLASRYVRVARTTNWGMLQSRRDSRT